MNDADYNALLEREHTLWKELRVLEDAVRAKDREWEAANEALHDENRRRAVRARLDDRVAAEQRNPQGAA
jgi:hypothetical protein